MTVSKITEKDGELRITLSFKWYLASWIYIKILFNKIFK